MLLQSWVKHKQMCDVFFDQYRKLFDTNEY